MLEERAFFDTFPRDDKATFNGTWSNYSYFESGTVAVTGSDDGLFLLKVRPEVLAQHADTAPLVQTGAAAAGKR